MASRLNLPARKMFIKDLVKCCKAAEEIVDIPDLNVWKCVDATMSVTFSVVWIQGIVKEVNDDNFVVSDTTGHARILMTNALPPGCPMPSTGKYMMIVGELIQAGSQPVVHAIKIQDLTEDAALQKIWNLEIEDSRRTDLGSELHAADVAGKFHRIVTREIPDDGEELHAVGKYHKLVTVNHPGSGSKYEQDRSDSHKGN